MAEPTLAMSPPMSVLRRVVSSTAKAIAQNDIRPMTRVIAIQLRMKSASGGVDGPAVPSWRFAAFPMNSFRPRTTVTPASSAAPASTAAATSAVPDDKVLTFATAAVFIALPQSSARPCHQLSGLNIRLLRSCQPPVACGSLIGSVFYLHEKNIKVCFVLLYDFNRGCDVT